MKFPLPRCCSLFVPLFELFQHEKLHKHSTSFQTATKQRENNAPTRDIWQEIVFLYTRWQNFDTPNTNTSKKLYIYNVQTDISDINLELNSRLMSEI